MPKSLIRLFSILFPNLMVRLAYRQLNNPQVRKLRAHEDEVLEQSEISTLPFKEFDIKLYHWPGSGPRVLLIHGWEGQAGNFSDLVPRLQAAGMDIYAFDAPAHGYSSRGTTSLFDFTDLVGLLIGKFEVQRLISHSFGGVATTYALSQHPEYQIERYALITCPDKFSERVDDVAEMVGITDKVKHKLVAGLEQQTGMDMSQMNVSTFVPTLAVQQAFMIADTGDKVIPIERSRRVAKAWGDTCRFVEVSGTGHFRILRTESVLEQVVDFIAGD
ncbi:MAG: alpha/beta hydrolase [Bacteroidota bacterium]